ncbi:2-phosphoglycerate kinase [Linum grandiflorum]
MCMCSQSDLEVNLFKLMERRGYGEEYINRYKMMTRFHHQRVPLVILVCGTACVGKSTIATQLAQRLNLPNVLQTEMVYELLRTSTDAPLSSTPVWARDFSSPEEFITEFCRECRIVRKGLAGDLKKAMKDGKPIIIEGIHLDPSIYLMDEDNKTPASVPERTGMITPFSVEKTTLGREPSKDVEDSGPSVSGIQSEDLDGSRENEAAEEAKFGDKPESHLDNMKNAEGPQSRNENKATKGPNEEKNLYIKKAKSGADPIIIPIVLKMGEFDHKALLEEWISARIPSDKYQVKDKDRLMANLKTLQDYLCSFTSQGLTVANISATTFPQTLDWLHGYLLQCIEQGISSVSNENDRQPARN